MASGGPQYDTDPADGMRAMIVKEWAREKYKLLDHYVEICRGVRQKHGGLGCYIELFAGPGRVFIRGEPACTDGSPIVAWKRSAHAVQGRSAPFAHCFLADADDRNVQALRTRMDALGAPATLFCGPASKTVDDVMRALPPNGFHFAFLDPFSIKALPFEIIEKLATRERLDLLVHFSVMDVVRNLGLNLTGRGSNLEPFAPNWQRSTIERGLDEARRRYFEHWAQLAERVGKKVMGRRVVIGSGRRNLYWLVLLSRHKLAERFWNEIIPAGPQMSLLG